MECLFFVIARFYLRTLGLGTTLFVQAFLGLTMSSPSFSMAVETGDNFSLLRISSFTVTNCLPVRAVPLRPAPTFTTGVQALLR